ncbi:hypothetical protein C8Q80DRAFT_1143856 [Daedaleopsis nitida]|nr:hypothetical protein C8Q80DRAFT_1143856 [Daedaleopsis nitida]
MSGSHLVEQPPEAAAKHPTADPHSEDYAASLRAAALLTLKSKRRRLTVESSDPAHPPRHLVAPPSNQLDYGPEEPSGGVSSIASSPAMRPTASTVPVPDVMDVDDAQAREEGEISDSETPPPSSPVNFNPTPASPKIQPEQMPPPPVPKVEPLSPALPFAAAVTDGTSTSALAPGMYCRPGLRMTEAQYNAARDIILDVLGWGVPPEYLVQIGLSRETIYYIFVDHNLRLPKNMNFKGLPPVVPPPASSAAAANGYSAPTNPPVPSMPSDDSPSALSVSALPFVPGGAANGSSTQATSLHDIEQQRRQELLARKAAQATRKLKQQESVSSTDSQLSTTSAPAVPVPAHTVDDFLKSIDPILPSDVGTSTSTSNVPPASRSSSRSFSVDPMDVDEIPGLTGNFSATTDYTLNPRPAPPRSANPPVATSSSPNVSMPQDRPLNAPSAVGNGNGALPYDDDMESIPGLFQQRRSPSDDSQLANGRRGTKRPVAADFVDMEPGPSRGPSRGIPRRRTTGFSGIQQRRCVIELSDTEEEREDAPPTANGIPMRADSRGFTVGTPQVSIAPTPRVNSPAIPPSATPAALLEKEEQIRQMREKIARAEQVLLRKQVSKTRNALSSTDVQVNGTSAPTQEEDDPSIVQSRLSSRSSSSATPDPSTFPRLNDRADEPPPHVTDGAVISLPNSETTSQAMTPIENCSRFLEHPTTGDKDC